MSYRYRLYELNIETPFPCPILTPTGNEETPDVIVAEGSVPRRLQNPVAYDDNWDAEPGRFLLRGGRRAGRFLVEEGARITLERNAGAEDELLAALFITWVIVALLRQRGLLVLHANVALTPNGAVAISGTSGSGKTSTVAALVERGSQLVTDDVTVLRFGNSGEIVVLPGVSKLNLCEDTAVRLGYDVETLPRNPLRRIKVMAPVNAMFGDPVKLDRIYLLNQHPSPDVVLSHLAGREKFAALQECVYGPMLPGEHPGQFALFTAVVNQVQFCRVLRPGSRWSLHEIVEAICNG